MTKQITITNDFDETVTIREGGTVEFKADYEQIGGVLEIRGDGPNAWVTIEAPTGGFIGEYIGGRDVCKMQARDLTPVD